MQDFTALEAANGSKQGHPTVSGTHDEVQARHCQYPASHPPQRLVDLDVVAPGSEEQKPLLELAHRHRTNDPKDADNNAKHPKSCVELVLAAPWSN